MLTLLLINFAACSIGENHKLQVSGEGCERETRADSTRSHPLFQIAVANRWQICCKCSNRRTKYRSSSSFARIDEFALVSPRHEALCNWLRMKRPVISFSARSLRRLNEISTRCRICILSGTPRPGAGQGFCYHFVCRNAKELFRSTSKEFQCELPAARR
jgi:hypothetical protein